MTKKAIAAIVVEAWRLTPAQRASYELYSKGVTSADVNECHTIPDQMRIAVVNYLRDLELVRRLEVANGN